MSFTNNDDIYNVPLGETYGLNGLGGTDTLVLNWSSLTGPISFWTSGGWSYYSDEATNLVEYYSFERFQLTGGAGGDDLRGGGDNDSLSGGGGADSLTSGLGADVINGGAGTDQWRAAYGALSGGVTIQLLSGGAVSVIDATNAQVSNVESLYFEGGIGVDYIDTSAVRGNDELYLGAGDDTAKLGLGRHYVHGQEGTDTLILDYSSLAKAITTSYLGGGWYRVGEQQRLSNYADYYAIERFQLTGGSGHDNISGGNDADILVGNAGHDTLDSGGGLGIDNVVGGDGNDLWVFNLSAYTGTTVNVSANAGICTDDVGDPLHSVSGIERITGTFGAGSDIVTTRAGALNDTAWLGGGNDRFNGGRGKDWVDAGEGEDTLVLNWSAESAGILSEYTGGGWYRMSNGVSQIDYYGFDRFNLTGTSGDDRLNGGGAADTLTGGLGNDTLNSGTGDATILGGAGAGTLPGADLWEADLRAESASININLLAGQTTAQGTAAGLSIRQVERLSLYTGIGSDSINASGYALNDSISLSEGNDSVNAGGGIDTVDGGGHTNKGDLLIGDFAGAASRVAQTYLGGGWSRLASVDGLQSVDYYGFERFFLTGGSGDDSLEGYTFGDTLTGSDTLVGGAGDDVLNGQGGKDVINGGDGTDRWIGYYGGNVNGLSLTLTAAGNGTLAGTGTTLSRIEDVTLTTGSGNDTVNTSAVAGGEENLSLGGGNDRAVIGGGNSRVDMGDGNDVLVIDFTSSGAASVRMFYTGGGWWRATDGLASITSVDFYGVETLNVTGGAGDDRLRGFGGADNLKGGDGADVLTGYEGDDVLTGGDGADVFVVTWDGGWGSEGTDLIADAAAGDRIRVNGMSASGNVTAVTNNGATTGLNAVQMQVIGGETWLYIGRDSTAGADVKVRLQGVYDTGDFALSGRDIRLVGGAETTGGAGADTISGTSGNDSIDGGGGNDKLSGLAGEDELDGGDGTDTLIGGLGADTLAGGANTDVFVYASVSESAPGSALRDVITDFVFGVEKINLAAIDANPYLAGDQAFAWRGANAFTGAAGQLRYDAATDMVEADVTGDAVADLQIKVNGLVSMAASDFVL